MHTTYQHLLSTDYKPQLKQHSVVYAQRSIGLALVQRWFGVGSPLDWRWIVREAALVPMDNQRQTNAEPTQTNATGDS